MNGDSSLILLADVALENPNTWNNVCRKRRRPRMVLEVKRLNGVDHAEVTDLKCLPINTLFNMFIEKFEDKRLRSPVFVCRYGGSQSCNIRFTDVDEKISRLEHLLHCHLLEHLMKTKTGSMIKLPKMPLEYRKSTILGSGAKQSIVKRNVLHFASDKMNQKIYFDQPEKKLDELPVDRNTKSTETNSETDTSMRINLKNVECVDVDLKEWTLKAQVSERLQLEEDLKLENPVLSIESCLRKISFDHSYSTQRKPSSNGTSFTSGNFVTPLEFRNLDINKLYCLNSESSAELNSFMLQETLQRQVSVFVVEGDKLIVTELPLVGSEIEVTTEVRCESQPAATAIKLVNEETQYSLCEEKISSRKSLLPHTKEKHSDVENGNHSDKLSNRARQHNEDVRSVKRKRQSVPGNSNIDLEVVKENKYNSIDNFVKRCDASILKTALLKDSNGKKPVINISNVWNSINVQYI